MNHGQNTIDFSNLWPLAHMSFYTVSSTKSYMDAMHPMIEKLSSLDVPRKEKVPKIDLDESRIIPVDEILSKFHVSTDILDRIVGDKQGSVVKEIRGECERISGANGNDGEALFTTIVNALKQDGSDEQLQSMLFDIVGFENFDFIAKVLQNKSKLVEDDGAGENDDKGPAIMTTEERVQFLRDNQTRAKNQPLNAMNRLQKYPHVYKKQDIEIAPMGGKFVLPEGSERIMGAKFEEIKIPIPEHKANKWISDRDVVKIKDLDFLCQGTFKNYKSLNKVQSLVFPVAYNTNENMLICAPTGAGKTDVALLAILHTIDQFVTESVNEDGQLDLEIGYEEFKIIYVAPLKALAAEIVEKYNQKLNWLGIKARELTGDMQLTKSEIMATQVIVTTPEKWDVVTRKSSGDNDLISKVKLLIIDEVHLLHEDRGSVIETLVARTLRQVESSQSMIRVVGLSATLPNYVDVADFLGVNRNVGMFFFDSSFRPIPLEQRLIGVQGKPNTKESYENLDNVCYDRLMEYIEQGLQVMVFVHSRKDTVKTANGFITIAQSNHELDYFNTAESCKSYEKYKREAAYKNVNKDVRELFKYGFGVHHAGMLRSDRKLTEKMFADGAIKVLCCTATLAWGVNLPAAVVIIKGTQIYDPKRGGRVDLGISDVIQIFGRAGRPQYEQFGTGILLTTKDKLNNYVSLITQQHPIESKFSDKLTDILNAEISLGTITNMEEAIQWLGYTYMMIRMRKNPFGYGIEWKSLQEDPLLYNKRRSMIVSAGRRLHHLQMIVFDENTGTLAPKDLGRVASDFYLLNNSVEIFNQMLNPEATEADVLSMISMSSEFDSIKYREEESRELKKLMEDSSPCQVAGEVDSTPGKTNILLQSYISRAVVHESSLISDSNYVAQNSARICRALFLIGINRRWGTFSKAMLSICKAIDKRMWAFDHPLCQFDIPETIKRNLRNSSMSMDYLRSMDARELGELVHNIGMGKVLHKLIDKFPHIEIDSSIFPITANVMRLHVSLDPDFYWDEKYHGNTQFFWVTAEQSTDNEILHVEKFILGRKQMKMTHEMDFMIPISDPPPSQINVRVISDTWMGSESAHAVSFQHLITPSNETIRTNLLRLRPLPITALRNNEIESIYRPKFRYFNPMQTMTFHSLYNSNSSVFVGSPTGSGKTVVAELAIWQAFKKYPGSKVVYIAPMKALVRERVDDWKSRICRNTRFKLVELTGDSLPEANEVRAADIIITTPEKFDGISRNWQTRKFVQQVSLVIMDEIHLLASDRGPILEMIVSRMNYISSEMKRPVRLLGMSTAVSNAIDMASWLGVKEGLFNFPQSVRPVPLQMYIDGFPDNMAFCPYMKTMNKPAFTAIKQHSPDKPVLIFVASRRQTRLTALDIIHLCGLESNPRRFLKMDDYELQNHLDDIKDETLKLSMQFGIGIHHAGLVESDRSKSHKLFESGKLQILIATSTLAWGVNLPAHLVIIKGTQFFDPKIEAYRDMDLTDILQMMGRAGRPSFDTSGTAIVYTKESKKQFYKHFLNVGFPVESSLHKVLDNHIGAEISAGTISSRQEAMDFLTWTFLYRRVHNNPTYYGIEDISQDGISLYLTKLIDDTIDNLIESKCVVATSKERLVPTPFIHISSYYYLSHKTVRSLLSEIHNDFTFRDCLRHLCKATEYDELATRHGEELINLELSQAMRYQADDMECQFIWDPHVKAYLLIQAYMSRVELPIIDYVQDTVSVLDQSLRIIQAYVDISAELGYLDTSLMFIKLMQCIKQRYWFDDDPVTALPGIKLSKNNAAGVTLEDLGHMNKNKVSKLIRKLEVKEQDDDDNESETDNQKNVSKFLHIVSRLPVGRVTVNQNTPEKLTVTLRHTNPPFNKNFGVHCPHFPKAQRESWFVVVFDQSNRELLLLKRASPVLSGNKGVVTCHLDVSEDIRQKNVSITMINDGMDISYQTIHTLL